MRIWIVLLAACAALFGATALYLHHELGVARGNDASTALVVTSTSSREPIGPPRESCDEASASVSSATTPSSATPATGMTFVYVGGNAQEMAELDRRELSGFADPKKRQRLLDDARQELRGNYRDLRRFLGVDASTEEQILGILAAEQLRVREVSLRCQVENVCERQEGREELREKRLQKISALLGSDKTRRFDEYESSLQERVGVMTLRGRFDDATRLTDDQTERLIATLADVRRRTREHLLARRVGFGEVGDSVLVLVASSAGGTPDAEMAEAKEYAQTLHERAAQILAGDQLVVFDAALADSLHSFEANLRARSDSSR